MNTFKRFGAVLLLITVLLSLLAPSFISANSAIKYYEGISSQGVTVKNDSCPVIIEHETLTFELSNLPASALIDNGEYSASVTAEYTLRNPSDSRAELALVFPFGKLPSYARSVAATLDDPSKYSVTLDGDQVETTLRATYNYWDSYDNAQNMALLKDAYINDSFYSPDTPVHIYRYTVDMSRAADKKASIAVSCDLDADKTRLMIHSNDGGLPSYPTYYSDYGYQSRFSFSGSGTFELYYIGEMPEAEPAVTAHIFSNDLDGEHPDAVIRRPEEKSAYEVTTLHEMIMSYRTADSESISDRDWYNALIAYLNESDAKSDRGFVEAQSLFRGGMYQRLLLWYEYSIGIDPHSTVTNTVTAPMYPSIDEGYEPPVYEYTYLLSPAATWAGFGTLDIVVNTPYYILDCEENGFKKSDTGYTLHLDGLPGEELTFRLSESEDPKENKMPMWPYVLLFLMISSMSVIVIIGIVKLIVFIIKKIISIFA